MEQNLKLIQLHLLDWLVIAAYGVVTFGIAYWAMRNVKDVGSLLVGKRRAGKWMLIASGFAGGTNANHPVGTAAATYQNGIPGMWITLSWMLLTPMVWVFPPAIRRLRVVTIADIVKMRFGAVMDWAFKLVTICKIPIAMGLGIKSAALVLEVMSGGAISNLVVSLGGYDRVEDAATIASLTELAAALFIAIPTLIYTLMGGIIAAYTSDLVQGLLIFVLSFILVPFGINRAGGFDGLRGKIDMEMTSLFSSLPGEFGFWWVFWFTVAMAFSMVIAGGGSALAAKSEYYSRMGVIGTIVKRFCTIGWGLVGVIGIVIYTGTTQESLLTEDAGLIFPLSSGDLLPVILAGLMVASILAAVMSSLDAGILAFGGMAVNNYYQPYFVKNASAQHYLLMTRILSGLGLTFGIIVAWSVKDIVYFMTIVEPIASLTGVPLLLCLLWRRMTAAGAVASVLVGVPLFLAVSNTTFSIPFTEISLFKLFQLDHLAHAGFGLYGFSHELISNYMNEEGMITSLPVQIRFPLYLLPALFMAISVSLLTRQHNQKSVDEFYCRLDTPVGEEHKIRDAGFTVDHLERLDREAPEIDLGKSLRSNRLLFVDLLRLPKLLKSGEAKLSDYRTDFIGIALCIVFVVFFLFGVDVFTRWLFQA